MSSPFQFIEHFLLRSAEVTISIQ